MVNMAMLVRLSREEKLFRLPCLPCPLPCGENTRRSLLTVFKLPHSRFRRRNRRHLGEKASAQPSLASPFIAIPSCSRDTGRTASTSFRSDLGIAIRSLLLPPVYHCRIPAIRQYTEAAHSYPWFSVWLCRGCVFVKVICS